MRNIEVNNNFEVEDLQEIIRTNGIENVIFIIPKPGRDIEETYEIRKTNDDLYNPLREFPYKISLKSLDVDNRWDFYMSDLTSLIKSKIAKIFIKN